MKSPGISSIANPVRAVGAARVVAGGWLVAKGVMMLTPFGILMPMAQRLFNGDPGTTDAPIRSLLTLVTAPILIVIGVALMVKGVRWMRRIPLPTGGPAALDRDEVLATLVRREAPAFGPGTSLPYWPLRRWLRDTQNDLPWWRRDLMSRGVRALVRSCGFVAALGILYVALRSLRTDDLLGPFPAAFAVLLLFVTAMWAALGLMLIPSDGRRIESFEFALPPGRMSADTVMESPPRLLDRESAALGVTLGIVGVGVQCLIASWWQLSFIGFPLMATSIIRHIGSLAGGIFFFVLGGRMATAATELLSRFRYASTVVYVKEPGVGYGATVRTESRRLDGPRHIIVAVASFDAREAADSLVNPGTR